MGPRSAASSAPIIVFVAGALCFTAPPLRSQWLNYRVPGTPRTADGKVDLHAPTPKAPDGKPDLSGVWESGPDHFYDLATGLKPGDVVMLPWAKALQADREGQDHENDPLSQCMPPGVPRINMSTPAAPHPFKIVQTPSLVILLYETSANSTFRQVFLDGRPLPRDPQPTWLGYSIGHWEGDALVVDTIGFNGRTRLDTIGHPHSDKMHVTQRFELTDPEHMSYEVTIDDPAYYTRPWKNTRVFTMLKPGEELIEYSCEENNRDFTEGHIK